MSDHAGHHHAPKNFNRAFAVGIGLNAGFIVLEVIFGLLSDSLALLADAGHNLSDVLSLLLAWVASLLAGRPPTNRRTYGYGRATILASLVSSTMLLLAAGAIGWEAIHRLTSPSPVDGFTMIFVAGAGVLVNGYTAWLFASGSHDDLNIRAAFLHMAADAAVSLGVVISGLGILLLGWLWLDPVITMLIVIAILFSTLGIFRDSVDLAFDAVPRDIDPDAVREYLRALPGVAGIHDLHIWAISTTDTALTAHLEMPDGNRSDQFLIDTVAELRQHFGIAHATIQIEYGDSGDGCDQSC